MLNLGTLDTTLYKRGRPAMGTMLLDSTSANPAVRRYALPVFKRGLPSRYHYRQCISFAADTTDEGAQAMLLHPLFCAWPVCNFVKQEFTFAQLGAVGW